MKAEVNSIFVTPVMFTFMISYISCFEKHYFYKHKIKPFYYNEIVRTFISTTTLSCVNGCAIMEKPCTHVILQNDGQGRIQCSLFDARNQTYEFIIEDFGLELWVNDHFNTDKALAAEMNTMITGQVTIDIVSNLRELNMENDQDFNHGDAEIVSDHVVCLLYVI